jgi:2-phosphosulfolactate phosphatase
MTDSNISSRIDLFFTPAAVTNERLQGYTVIVVDVLRSATTISTALMNGAREVIPAVSPSAAIDLVSEMRRDDVILCGERSGNLIDGFDLGNSPGEFTRAKVEGKTLVFGSNKGSPAVVSATVAKSVFLCGFMNIDKVVEKIENIKNPFPIAVLCAGKRDSFALEDAVCGGLILNKLLSFYKNKITYNDAGKAARLLSDVFGDNIIELLHATDHGQYLTEIGLGADIEPCAKSNSVSVVPVLYEGKLVDSDKI